MVFVCQSSPPTLKTSQYSEKERGDTFVCITKEVQILCGKIIENSILGYYGSKYMGLIPHPTLIIKLCILGSVKRDWEEEETCLKLLL